MFLEVIERNKPLSHHLPAPPGLPGPPALPPPRPAAAGPPAPETPSGAFLHITGANVCGAIQAASHVSSRRSHRGITGGHMPTLNADRAIPSGPPTPAQLWSTGDYD